MLSEAAATIGSTSTPNYVRPSGSGQSISDQAYGTEGTFRVRQGISSGVSFNCRMRGNSLKIKNRAQCIVFNTIEIV